MFTPAFKDFGTITQGSKNTVNIDFDSSVKMITRLTTPCGCIVAKVDTVNRQIVVTYTPKDVPLHLVKIGKNFYEPILPIEIEYDSKDGTSSKQTVNIIAKVTT